MSGDNVGQRPPAQNAGQRAPAKDAEVRLPWMDVARRLQGCARATGKLSLISITVLVDDGGTPIAWLEPNVRKIEPHKAQSEILAIMAAASKTFDGRI